MLGFKALKQLVIKLMKKSYLQSILKRKFKITTNSSHKYAVVENKLNREFTVIKENKACLSDHYIYQNWSRMVVFNISN